MKARNLHRWILLGDLVWVPAAMMLAWILRYGSAWTEVTRESVRETIPFLIGTLFLWILLSASMKLDGFRRGWRLSAVVAELFLACCCLMGVLLAAAYLLREYASRLALAYFGVALFVGFIAIRHVAFLMLQARYRKGDVQRAVIIGSGPVAREIVSKIERHPEMLCKVVGFLFPQNGALDPGWNSATATPGETFSTLGAIDCLREQRVNEIILALPRVSVPEVLNFVARSREMGINVSVVPQPYELYLSRPRLLDLGGLPLLQLRETAKEAGLRWKRAVDIAFALLLTVPGCLFVLPSALVLHLRKRKGFCWETRCGQFGKPFRMLRLNVDRNGLLTSRFERLLVDLSITEAPQLWNVLRGDMSMVGPRPEPPERVRRYSEWQQQRLSLKPGMTGLAQVHGLREQSSSEEKTRFDLQYFLHPSPLTDLSLLLQTLATLAMRVVLTPGRTAPASISDHVLYNVVDPQLRQEIVPVAHRSQPSAD
jgi:lipopolysaccharide/colanic/teichoic acid biosynthesis glycosyltransferase